ncbi:MAG: hypothetical protein Q8L64_05970 [bacterium]|nr:hypothetical protein [bacterium]
MNRLEKQRLEGRRKLVQRTLFSVIATVLVIGTAWTSEYRWSLMIFWVTVAMFFNWRQWMVFVKNGSFLCFLCRKLKENKHLAPIDSLPVPAGDPHMECCDACASRLRENLRLLEESKVRAARYIGPPRESYLGNVPAQGAHAFAPPVCRRVS